MCSEAHAPCAHASNPNAHGNTYVLTRAHLHTPTLTLLPPTKTCTELLQHAPLCRSLLMAASAYSYFMACLFNLDFFFCRGIQPFLPFSFSNILCLGLWSEFTAVIYLYELYICRIFILVVSNCGRD